VEFAEHRDPGQLIDGQLLAHPLTHRIDSAQYGLFGNVLHDTPQGTGSTAAAKRAKSISNSAGFAVADNRNTRRN